MVVQRCIGCMENIGRGAVCSRCGYDNSRPEGLSFVLAPNTILNGKYLTGRVLGQGGFGITYIGFDLALERKVAIKEYYPSQTVYRDNRRSNKLVINSARIAEGQWRSERENFYKEARKLAKMTAIPEIVRVQDVFNENNTAYIVMDYVEGETLKDIQEKKGPMPYSEAVRLLLPLIRALDKAHAQGMIHRDISPDNIMIRPDGSPCLLDFGAAKDLNAQNPFSSMKVVKTGFAPFEQYMTNGTTGPWTDVYAMCATLLYLVTGTVLPGANDRMDNDRLPLGPGCQLTVQQQEVLKDGLAVLYKNRIQSMWELAERLERSLVNPGRGGPEQWFKKNWKILAAAGAAAVLSLFALFFILRYIDDDSGRSAREQDTPAPVETVKSHSQLASAEAKAVYPELTELGYEKTRNGRGIKINSYTGQHEYLAIPDEIDGLPVVELDFWTFKGHRELLGVFFGDNMRTIGSYAFYNCDSLEYVKLGSGVESLGEYAFSYCYALKEISLPSALREIGECAFYDCSALKEIDIPSGVEEIKRSAFRGCGLSEAEIPDGCRVYENAFEDGVKVSIK